MKERRRKLIKTMVKQGKMIEEEELKNEKTKEKII
jgi:polyhydroxyalkanoate synthesis regulator phasin